MAHKLRTYVCLRYPEYAIGDKIKFHGGIFETNKPELYRLIESDEWYGTKGSGALIWRDDDVVAPPVSRGEPMQSDRGASWDFRNIPDESLRPRTKPAPGNGAGDQDEIEDFGQRPEI